MKSLFIVLFLTASSLSFGGTEAITKACDYVHNDSLFRLMCQRLGNSYLSSGDTEDVAVAKICDEITYIPENLPRFPKCFESALPGVQIPEGFPQKKPMICEYYKEFRKKEHPDMTDFQGWSCETSVSNEFGKSRTELCLFSYVSGSQRYFTHNGIFINLLGVPYPYAQSASAFEFNITVGSFSGSADRRVYWGKMISHNNKKTHFQMFYKQPWQRKETASYHLDKVNSKLSIISNNRPNSEYTCKKL